MTRLLKVTAILLCLSISKFVFAHATIGIFDVNRALFETDAWKSQLAILELEFSEEQATISGLREELTELFENMETNSATMTETELLRLREDSEFKQLRIQQIGERVQASLRATQNNFLERYRNLLGEALNEVYEVESFDFILKADSVVAAGFTYDVTPKVTAKLNDLIASANQ
ncbi:MAG: hypothetical protein DHS20C12_10820 [Pseudohongiella sp.]|nr:MAG: hypothetical protein DHS20C12_10820 [Pseudohongiella sp.]